MLSPNCYEVDTYPKVVGDHYDTRQTAFGGCGLPDDRKARRSAYPQIWLFGDPLAHLCDISLAEPNRLEQPMQQAPAFEDDLGC